MPNINNRVKLWRGTRAAYNALGEWDYWTEYNVKETNGTWTKYYGTKEVVGDVGELAPVIGILSPAEFSSLDATGKTQGSRWLVGSGSSYYVVEFGPNASVEAAKIQPLGNYSVRVEDHDLRAYELVNGELVTYDYLVDSELDENSPNPVSNSAITKTIIEDELAISAALNDLNDKKADKSDVEEALSGITDTLEDLEERKADKDYVDAAISASTIEVDEELTSGGTNPVQGGAIWQIISDDEETVAAALNELDSRVTAVENANISGTGAISTSGDIQNGVVISHKTTTVTDSTSATTIAQGGTFEAISKVEEDSYGHVTGVTKTTYTIPNSVTNVTATGDTYVSASVSNGSAVTIATNEVTTLTDDQASGTVADSKAIVDYVKSKLGAIKNVTTIGGVNVPTSAATFNIVSGNTLITVVTAADGQNGITTTITPVTASTDSQTVGLITNEELKRYVLNLLTSVMHFRGATGSLPASAETGDVYIVATSFTINGEVAEVGDYIVYFEEEGSAGVWTIIEKNDTGVVTSTGLTANALVVADSTNSVVSAGTVGDSTTPIYLNNGVPTPIDDPVSGTSELVYGSAVTLATVEGLDIVAELPELDTTLDSASTNAVENRAITRVILDNELVVAAAINDLNSRKADKTYVDDAISAITVDVVDCGATIPVNSSSATTLATVEDTPITGKVSMSTLTIAGANSLADGITFDGTGNNIEILVLDCGEY